MVEAAGIEPASTVKRKERWRATSVARARFSAESVASSIPLESPPVPSSPLESTAVLETFWRRLCQELTSAHVNPASDVMATVRGSQENAEIDSAS